MPVLLELFVVVGAMLIFFVLVFGFMYLLALSLFPIEKELSKIMWTEPKQPPAQTKPKRGGFKDFSRRHNA